jgi:hypothetical protein
VSRTVEEDNKHEAIEFAEDIGKWFSGKKCETCETCGRKEKDRNAA